MVIPIALAGLYVALVLVRLVAWRRLSPPRASSVWLFFTPQFFGPAGFLWAAATITPTSPLLGFVLAIVGLGYGALVLRMVRGVARGAATAKTPEDFANASVEPAVDYMLTMTVLSVMGLIVFGVVAIVWAVTTGSR